MLERGRYPTPEEIEAIISRAHQMRAEYLASLITRAALRAKQFFSRAQDRRITGAQRFYPDVG
jgi:hypothetical protein